MWSILLTFLYPALCDTPFRVLFKQLTQAPEHDVHELLPTPESLISGQNA